MSEDWTWMAELVEDGTLAEAVAHDHPEFSLQVYLDDEVAGEFGGWVDDLARALRRAPGVTRAIREDREVLLVAGDVDPDVLVGWIGDWWTARLHRGPTLRDRVRGWLRRD